MKTITLVSLLRAAPVLTATSALLWGGVAQAQPFITSIYPDGLVQFQETNKLEFTIDSTVGVSAANISVQLGATNPAGIGTLQILWVTNGLTVTGPSTSLLVTAPLTSNMAYTATIEVVDTTGAMTNTYTFDTITPAFTWESEDYDYGGGKFIDNPQTNAYAGLVAITNMDAFNPNGGGASYRPINTGDDTGTDLGTEATSDRTRVQYLYSGEVDYDVGWNNGGSGLWANYTRHYPAGKWNIFLRAAGWATTTESAVLNQDGPSGTLLGRFVVPNTSTTASTYQNFTWAPLTDVAGNLIEWDTDGSQKTLTIMTVSGNYNANFFMLMPVDPNYKPKPFVSSVNPNGSQMFASTNLFTFTVNSVPGITTNNVVVTLNGLKPAGLTLSGSSRVLKGSCPLATNVVYTATITLTDANGSSTYTTIFGTFQSNNYTFEAEDWDYDNGKFFDNPQLNAYAGQSGVDGVDAHNTSGGSTAYRPSGAGDLGNEGNGDQKRAQYVSAGTNDYDIGWTAGGQWANYTRTYPKGVYNVYLRAASPNAGRQANASSLAWVTSGVGTDTQTLGPSLGTFNVPPTGSWQVYSWAPLVDSLGNPAKITASGAVSTLRMSEHNGGNNMNFFMLVPADTMRPVISQVYPDGSAMFQRTNTLSFVASSPVGVDPNLVTVTLNGLVVSNLIFSGSGTNLTVSDPNLQLETAYTATITVNTSNNQPASLTYTFDTFSSNYYTFEAEDFDYEGGKFFDNPQLDSYAGLLGTDGVDAHNASGGATAYRSNDAGDLGNEVNGDHLRAQYVSAGTNDYDIGWTAAGQWANYTRTYPKGVYNVYLRAASPNGTTDAVSLAWVTSGQGTTNQTLGPSLGAFNVPSTSGYQNYTWVPLVDSLGNRAQITTSGAVATLRMTEVKGGYNLNFFMLVQAAATAPNLSVSLTGDKVIISFPTQTGAIYQVQYKNNLTDSAWTPLGSPISGTGVPGSVQDSLAGSARFYRAVLTAQ